MEKSWFNLMFSKGELEYRGELSKAMDSFAPSEKTTISQDRFIYDMDKNFYGWGERSSYSNNVDLLVSSKDIGNFISDYIFFVRDSNKNSYSIYFDKKKKIFEIDNDFSDLEKFFYSYCSSSYLNNRSKGDNDLHSNSYIKDTKYNFTNYIKSCIDSYFRSYICIDSNFLSDSNNSNERYIYNFICSESGKIRESKNYKIRTNRNRSNLISSKDFDITQNYNQLWIQCDNCYELMYKKAEMNVCEECGHYLKITSSERIELSIDPGTWNPMDEDMVSADPIKFHSKEEPYKKRINSAQKTTGLTDAVQTGTGQLNGIPVALGVMDFQFMGGSMGSVVGEKITRLIEYATNQCLPLILVCSSGGARMQEGSFSLMQMAKISSVLCDYQSSKKLFYISILTSPTTGGVTASFGMLGDIIIAEPYAYIAFAGKRVIEQTLKKAVPEGSQAAESLLRKGLLDAIVPRNLLKGVLNELFQLHAFFPLNKNKIK
uniref:Acetyl-coenzyme A carboxylase carboxyl transferase subunit beta, chloroplastic n=3 Tax=Erysimum TaxID=65352 RepID=A0A6M8NSY5_9BRAS|nr:carboxytransferase beta subunit [Erysimum bicolor]YP_009896017.1 carboxytransferase beta subunit [Erysimum odoratum]YP_010323505.1 carboxytransferase beta subunit [Erysimum wardii]YP_010896377.1 carboxytransferase beta subunit [Erysimum flavum]YP_010896464.1 carboxytransferase beta subunit [Erysimum hieraciifolium]YP_010896550.1 acetyl-CoA carboxylase carboxyltransferase beta subunit [Erysimum quadrangulum]YP_010896637.1 carboxytransferase beta subunit [Erysimum siliculosum]YP_010896724.1